MRYINVAGIRCVNEGQVWANSRQRSYILEALVQPRGQVLLGNGEHEIVSKVAEGVKNREIAELLHLSKNSTKNHLFRIYERLGISNRAELIHYLHSQRTNLRIGEQISRQVEQPWRQSS